MRPILCSGINSINDVASVRVRPSGSIYLTVSAAPTFRFGRRGTTNWYLLTTPSSSYRTYRLLALVRIHLSSVVLSAFRTSVWLINPSLLLLEHIGSTPLRQKDLGFL